MCINTSQTKKSQHWSHQQVVFTFFVHFSLHLSRYQMKNHKKWEEFFNFTRNFIAKMKCFNANSSQREVKNFFMTIFCFSRKKPETNFWNDCSCKNYFCGVGRSQKTSTDWKWILMGKNCRKINCYFNETLSPSS